MSVGAAKAAQVSVRAVPSVLDRRNLRLSELAPAVSVSVPLMVWLSEKAMDESPAAARAATVKLLNVFAPETVAVVMAVLVKLTL